MFTGACKAMWEQIFSGGTFDSISAVLKFNPEAELSTAWNVVIKIYSDVMVPIALGLMVIWFLVAFMEKSASEQVTFEQLFMLFAKLIAAKYLIDNGIQIFGLLWGLGISLIDNVSSAFGAGGAGAPFNSQDLWYKFTGVKWDKNLSFGDSFKVMFQLLLPYIASIISVACVYFICYSRLIEMLVRICGAPIAVSDFMSEGLHGAGWRYLKNFLAICLQGMIIIIVSELHAFIMYDVFVNPPNSAWTTLLMQVAISFASIALMFKSLTISKELVGTS